MSGWEGVSNGVLSWVWCCSVFSLLTWMVDYKFHEWHCSGRECKNIQKQGHEFKTNLTNCRTGPKSTKWNSIQASTDYSSIGEINANKCAIGMTGQRRRKGSGDYWRSQTDCESTMPYCCQNPKQISFGDVLDRVCYICKPQEAIIFPHSEPERLQLE